MDRFGYKEVLDTEKKKMREFDSGATRDSEQGKLDYEGFLSPLCLFSYAEYLNKHRVQSDGGLRDSDNWQKGMDKSVYMKSLCRHFMDVWLMHRGYTIYKEKTANGEVVHVMPNNHDENLNLNWIKVTMEDALNGVIFNAFGYNHENLKCEK